MNDFSAVTVNQFHPSHGIRKPPVSYSVSGTLWGQTPSVHPFPGQSEPPAFHDLTASLNTHPLPNLSLSLHEGKKILLCSMWLVKVEKVICPGGKALWGSKASLCIPAPSPHSGLGHRPFLKHYTLFSPHAFLLATPPTLTTSLSSRAQRLSSSNLSSGKLWATEPALPMAAAPPSAISYQGTWLTWIASA